jgi:hypothetical protein
MLKFKVIAELLCACIISVCKMIKFMVVRKLFYFGKGGVL